MKVHTMLGFEEWVVPTRRHRRLESASSGQALVEMSLLAPFLLLVVGLAFTGSQFLSSVIGLNGAARAGVIAVVNDDDALPPVTAYDAQVTAATAAANQEEGCNPDPSSSDTCFHKANDATAASCPSGNCVWIESPVPNSGSGKPIEVVHVSYSISSYVPFMASQRVAAQAGLEP